MSDASTVVLKEMTKEHNFSVEADTFPEAMDKASEVIASWGDKFETPLAVVITPGALEGFYDVGFVHLDEERP